MTIDYAKADFYTDLRLIDDPHGYFDYLRAQGPVTALPLRGVMAVTGYDELIQMSLDSEHFSAINAVTGPFPPLPFEPQGDDITAELEANRANIPFADQIVTQHGEQHARLRSIVARLFTPSRLKALESRLVATADALIDEFVATGRVELVSQYGGPFATLVIADLLGIPEDGRKRFRAYLANVVPAEIGRDDDEDPAKGPFGKVGKEVFKYILRRRVLHHPLVRPLGRMFAGGPGREDILAELATARFPDGSVPSLTEITGLGAFLFGAGQDTTNRLLASCLRMIAIRPDIQQSLRDQPGRIPDFIEEVLRLEGSVKSGGRLCQKTTVLGGVEVKAGTVMLMSHLAANRDPRRFSDPGVFDMDRPKLKEHVAFGRGAHTCIGAPLARREVSVSIERLLARMGNVRLAEDQHGKADDPRFVYEPTFILRALKNLHLEFDPR